MLRFRGGFERTAISGVASFARMGVVSMHNFIPHNAAKRPPQLWQKSEESSISGEMASNRVINLLFVKLPTILLVQVIDKGPHRAPGKL